MRSGTFGVFGFHFNKQRTQFGPLLPTLSGALVLAAMITVAVAADGEATKLDQPVRISVRTVDGEFLRGQIVSFGSDGFDLQDAKREQHKIAWTDLDARTVYKLHNDLLPSDDAAAWFALGERLLTQWEDGQPIAELAFNRAISLDRELAKRIESVKARAAEQRAKLAAEREQARCAEEAKAFGDEKVALDQPIRTFLTTVDGERHVGQIVAYSADGVDVKITPQAEADHIKWTDLAAKDAWETLNKLLPRDNAEAWFLAGQMLVTLDQGERFAEVAFNRAKLANPKVAPRIDEFKQERADAIAQAEAAAEAKRRAEQAAWFSDKIIELEVPVRITVQNSDGEPVIGQATAYNDAAVTLKLDNGESPDVEWSQFDAETAYQVIEQVLTHPTGEAWLNVGRKLYMFDNGEPIAERAFRQALRQDRTLGQRVNEAKEQLAHAKADAAKLAAVRKAKENQVWNAGKQGRFVVSLCEDLQGNIWVGTEDEGVWRYDPHEENKVKRWTQFTRRSTGGPPEEHGPTLTTGTPAENALGDDYAYALACDKLGRIWVGHLNHGVSVYNGEGWRNYDVLSGPLGERVFDIATCPTDGDVWIATDAGLTRYSVDNDEWSYITRADGLPEDQIQCLALAEDGTIYVGTQCHGLAIANPGKDGQYTNWRYVTAPRGFGDGGKYPIPLTPYGHGLPTDLINDIHVASDGTVWIATTTGLAFSRNQGRSWMYLRGADWDEKVRGLYQAPRQLPDTRKPPILLAEDYVTSVDELTDDKLLVTYRRRGAEIVSTDLNRKQAMKVPDATRHEPMDYAFTGLVASDETPWIGWYGGGITHHEVTQLVSVQHEGRTNNQKLFRLPRPADTSTISLDQLMSQLASVPTVQRQPQHAATCAGDDWRSQGDWVGRYGKFFASLSAVQSPNSYEWGCGAGIAGLVELLGPHCTRTDCVRYWVHWLYTTDPRSLELPPDYLKTRLSDGRATWQRRRRQASLDDHGEAYPFTHEGPDLYFSLFVPAGDYELSFYFVNKDGHHGNNRFRDYLLTIKGGKVFAGGYGDLATGDELATFERQPTLATARVRDFWSGVYKRFTLRGPNWYSIKLHRNYSFNTVLSAVMLDLLREDPPPYSWDASPEAQNVRRHIAVYQHQGSDAWHPKYMDMLDARDQEAAEMLWSEWRTRRQDFVSRFRLCSPSSNLRRYADELAWLRLRNLPEWTHRREVGSAAILRYLLQDDTVSEHARLEREAQYWLSLYGQWEFSRQKAGLPLARQIELQECGYKTPTP